MKLWSLAIRSLYLRRTVLNYVWDLTGSQSAVNKQNKIKMKLKKLHETWCRCGRQKKNSLYTFKDSLEPKIGLKRHALWLKNK